VATEGPLRVHPQNPRYFADRHGRPVYLAGSHTWANLLEMKVSREEPDFDNEAWLAFLRAHNHNFMRLWAWEHARWATWDGSGRHFIYPNVYARTGPGEALDGKPRFNLDIFDGAYFDRLRSRVEAAARFGVYVAVKLFDGFSLGDKSGRADPPPERNPFRGHPFHRDNNVNSFDGDPGRSGQGHQLHTLAIPEATLRQEAYVRRVIETVGDLDNVLYEISNESPSDSIEWQYHMIRFIRQIEAGRSLQHPIGMTVPFPGGRNRALFESPADWISPNPSPDDPYMDDPPPADGRKVIVSDTDHLWGHGGSRSWVYKSFARGLNVLLMDPWDPLRGSDLHTNNFREHPMWGPIRSAMGVVRSHANRLDLARLEPRGDLTSTRYALASAGRQYFVYQPDQGSFEVDLSGGQGPFGVEWFSPTTGESSWAADVAGGAKRVLTPPFATDAAVVLRSNAPAS